MSNPNSGNSGVVNNGGTVIITGSVIGDNSTVVVDGQEQK